LIFFISVTTLSLLLYILLLYILLLLCDWYKRRDGIVSTLIVPATKDSELANEVQEVIDRMPGPLDLKTKIIEEQGTALIRKISSSDPFKRQRCLRNKCPLSYKPKGCNSLCYSSNVNYKYKCLLCERGIKRKHEELEDNDEDRETEEDNEEDLLHLYKGESSLTLFARNDSHLEKLKNKQDYFILDHLQDKHPEANHDPNHFQMEMTSTDKDPLRHIIQEAILIKHSIDGDKEKIKIHKGDNMEKEIEVPVKLINSKREFFLPTINGTGTNYLRHRK